MKTIVTYKSKSGFVKRYAQWIAEALSADLYDSTEVTADRLLRYDIIIHGGGLYVGGINGVKLIIQQLDRLKNKHIIVFGTGATPYRNETNQEIAKVNFTQEQQMSIKFFYMRGGFDYNLLSVGDKILMNLLKLKLRLKGKKTADERGMLAAYSHPVDFTKESNIKPLVDYVKSLG